MIVIVWLKAWLKIKMIYSVTVLFEIMIPDKIKMQGSDFYQTVIRSHLFFI